MNRSERILLVWIAKYLPLPLSRSLRQIFITNNIRLYRGSLINGGALRVVGRVTVSHISIHLCLGISIFKLFMRHSGSCQLYYTFASCIRLWQMFIVPTVGDCQSFVRASRKDVWPQRAHSHRKPFAIHLKKSTKVSFPAFFKVPQISLSISLPRSSSPTYTRREIMISNYYMSKHLQ